MEDVRVIVQVEMMKYANCAAMCRVQMNQIEKYITALFVKDTQYFCRRSKFLVKDPDLQAVVDLLLEEKLGWYIESNLEGNCYPFVTVETLAHLVKFSENLFRRLIRFDSI